MKKIAVFFLCLILLSGCNSIDYDMMVCSFRNNLDVRYEVRYKDNQIMDIAIVEYLNLNYISEKGYKDRIKHIRKVLKNRDEQKGIKTYLRDDNKEVMMKTVVDINKYNCYHDGLSLFHIDIEKGDLENIEVLRNKLISKSGSCDEIVTLIPTAE